jgi:DNA-binding CsgD family transcriptional regulator
MSTNTRPANAVGTIDEIRKDFRRRNRPEPGILRLTDVRIGGRKYEYDLGRQRVIGPVSKSAKNRRSFVERPKFVSACRWSPRPRPQSVITQIGDGKAAGEILRSVRVDHPNDPQTLLGDPYTLGLAYQYAYRVAFQCGARGQDCEHQSGEAVDMLAAGEALDAFNRRVDRAIRRGLPYPMFKSTTLAGLIRTYVRMVRGRDARKLSSPYRRTYGSRWAESQSAFLARVAKFRSQDFKASYWPNPSANLERLESARYRAEQAATADIMQYAVLHLVGRGLTIRQIAASLDVSKSAVGRILTALQERGKISDAKNVPIG